MRRATATRRATAILVAAATFNACYGYSRVDLTPSLVGRGVRVELSDDAALRLASQIGPRATYVDGRLAAVSDSGVALAVTEVGRRDGTSEPWRGERVSMARTDAGSTKLRRTSTARSTALAVLLAGGAATIAALVSGGGGSTNPTSPANPGSGR